MSLLLLLVLAWVRIISVGAIAAGVAAIQSLATFLFSRPFSHLSELCFCERAIVFAFLFVLGLFAVLVVAVVVVVVCFLGFRLSISSQADVCR